MSEDEIKYLGVTVGMAINNAVLRVNTLPVAVTDSDEWSEKVLDYTEALLREMSKRGF